MNPMVICMCANNDCNINWKAERGYVKQKLKCGGIS